MLLETERLFIRYFSEEDKGDLYDYLSREEVVKYEPYTLYSRQAAAEEAARRAEDPDFYAVALKSGKVIGNLYLSKGDYDTWELGYVFNSDFWGNGYAYESAAALITQAFEEWGARRLVAMCNPQNQSSWKYWNVWASGGKGRLSGIFIFSAMKQGSLYGRILMNMEC